MAVSSGNAINASDAKDTATGSTLVLRNGTGGAELQPVYGYLDAPSPSTTKGALGANTTGAAVLVGAGIWENTGIFNGNADGNGDGFSGCNLLIKSWNGIGFVNGCSNAGYTNASSMTVAIDVRWGTIRTRGDIFLDGSTRTLQTRYVHAPSGYDLVTGSNGGLAVQVVAHNAWQQVRASAFNVQSSRLVKTNISTMTLQDAQKILQLRPINFDYKQNFGPKGQAGLIAEETLNIIPNVVTVPENYKESEFDESKGINQKILNIDYSKIVPYLIKLAQVQNEQIIMLQQKVTKLENKLENKE